VLESSGVFISIVFESLSSVISFLLVVSDNVLLALDTLFNCSSVLNVLFSLTEVLVELSSFELARDDFDCAWYN